MAGLIEHGGAIVIVLIALNILGLGTILWRAYDLISFNKNKEKHLEKFTTFLERYQNPQLSFAEKVNVALDHYMAPYRSGINSVRLIAAIAPLLGLLGTVIGIYKAFGGLGTSAEASVAVIAQGISFALITTVGGLIVAIPHYMAHGYLSSATTKAERKLEALYLTNK